MSLRQWVVDERAPFEELVLENAVEIALRVNEEKAARAFQKLATFESPHTYLVRAIGGAAEAMAHLEELQDIWIYASWPDVAYDIAEHINAGRTAPVCEIIAGQREQRIKVKAQALERQLVAKLAPPVKPRRPLKRTRRR